MPQKKTSTRDGPWPSLPSLKTVLLYVPSGGCSGMAFYPKTPSLWAMPAPVSQWMTSASRVSPSLKWVTLEYTRALPTARLAQDSPWGDMSHSHHKQNFLSHFSLDWLRNRATQNTQDLFPSSTMTQPLWFYPAVLWCHIGSDQQLVNEPCWHFLSTYGLLLIILKRHPSNILFSQVIVSWNQISVLGMRTLRISELYQWFAPPAYSSIPAVCLNFFPMGVQS